MQKIAAAFLLFLLPAFASSANAKTITLAADVWCPYNCEAGAENPGFMIEIAKKAFEKHDITVEYKTLAWDKAIDESRIGKYSGIVGASVHDAGDFIFPDLEQGWMQIQFFAKQGNKWHYLGKDSLAQVTLGVALGYTYGDTIDSYIRSNINDQSRIQAASGDAVLANNIEKLLSGKITALIEDAHVMNYYISKNKLEEKIENAGQLPISDQNNLFIAFSPKEESAKYYARILTEETKAMRESGELAAILAKYNVKDWRR